MSKEYDEIIKIGKEEYEKIEIPKYITEGKTLLKRMEKYKDNHLLFLKQDIPYTNNICERMLRGFKRKYDISCRFSTSIFGIIKCEKGDFYEE